MERKKKLIIAGVAAALWAILPVLLSRWLIRGLSGLFAALAGNLKLQPQLAYQITQALAQLKTAALGSPWLLAAIIGALMGGLHYVLHGRKGLWISLAALLPAVAAVLWYTGINGIRLGAVLGQLLPLIPKLL